MNCDECFDWMSQSLDGPLSPQEQRALEDHLNHCPACRREYQELKQLHQLLRHLGETPPPPGFADGVMARIRAPEQGLDQEQEREKSREKPKLIPLSRRPWVRALAGLAACGAIAIGVARYAAPTAADPDTPQLASLAPAAEDGAGGGSVAPYSLAPGGEAKTEPRRGIQSRQADVPAPASAPEGDTQLVLSELPDQAADLLPPLDQWQTDDLGRPVCTVTGETMEALCAALDQAGADYQRPPEPWSQDCLVILDAIS